MSGRTRQARRDVRRHDGGGSGRESVISRAGTRLAAAALLCFCATIARADPPPASSEAHASAPQAHALAAAADPERLPPDVTTHHTLVLPGRTLHFTATAGSIRLYDDKNAPQADVAYVAYQLDGTDKHTRAVAFVFNGGPGVASGYLQTGLLGPWRVALTGSTAVPPVPMPNADTWLDFTDLVFIDPPGTGFSRVLGNQQESRKRLFAVTGDVDALAEVIRRWVDRNERSVSPHYLVGESYGGFRAPRVARVLQSEDGVGVSGMVLISPFLDAHAASGFTDPFGWVDRLPSEVAAARALHAPVTRASVVDAEQYAATEYVTDLLRGERDTAALDRLATRVAALTGLDPALVRRYHGRLDADVFLHELQRARNLVGSVYDATIADPDPSPHRPFSNTPDPVTHGFVAPVTSAMVSIYTEALKWRPAGLYRLTDPAVFRQWDWGHGMGRPESLSFLQAALSVDPHLRVLIGQGLFDLVTPYFGTVLALRALPDVGGPDRVRLNVYPGGHMFYSEDGSRAAFRNDAQALFGG